MLTSCYSIKVFLHFHERIISNVSVNDVPQSFKNIINEDQFKKYPTLHFTWFMMLVEIEFSEAWEEVKEWGTKVGSTYETIQTDMHKYLLKRNLLNLKNK